MPINLTDSDALERLEAKLKTLTDLQEMMKAVNVIIRDKKMPAEEKIKIIQERHHLTRETADELVFPKESWERPGFPTYQLSNNNQEINRIKKRIAEVLKYRKEVQQAEETGELPEFSFNGGKIIDNIPENRLQIFFDAKPEPDIRTKLKQHGFRWAPGNSAWQSYRNPRNLEWAKQEFNATGVECAAE